MGFRISGRFTHFLPLALWATGAASCVAIDPSDGAEEIDGIPEAVVYDVDNRTDVYEAPPIYANIALGSVVSLIETQNLDVSDPAHVVVQPRAGTLRTSYRLCDGERFATQPTAARCTGTLIDDDLVLTAGHCARTLEECRLQYYVFGYAMDDATTVGNLTRADLFTCRNLIAHAAGEVDGQRVDYAIVQLDRPATPAFTVQPVDTSVPVMLGSNVVVIGAGSGLPLKVDMGGTVRRATGTNSFFVDTDTFGGNSGSGVLTMNGALTGVLVLGRTDYLDQSGAPCDEHATCCRVNVLAHATTFFEEVTYAARPIGELCDLQGAAWPSARLCGRAAACGDGTCSGTETAATCARDCPADRCGDGICQLHEDATCSADCIPRVIRTVPPEWTCPEGFFANHDGCQCGCGIADPDCSDTWQEVSGCHADQFCSARSGECITRGTEWTCEDHYYEDGQCDCLCGTRTDPDCNDAHAPRYGCDDPPSCSAPPTRPRAHAGTGARFVWLASGVVALALGARRRRRR